MKEKITGLDWRDFVGINLGIKELIKTYQAFYVAEIDNGSPMSQFWADEIEALEATLNRIDQNRSIDW